jgi:hypothetical protein
MNTVQLDQWFRAADEDRDGVIGGAEAVRFFQRSGLAQEVLGQVRGNASLPICAACARCQRLRRGAGRCCRSIAPVLP